MTIGWSLAVLIGCVALAIVCILIGVVRAALAARTVKLHAERLKSAPLLADAAEITVYLDRINGDVAAMEALVARAMRAVASIDESLHQLRIPEAVAALRVAGASIRLLLTGR